jgi:hypothetical protein
MSSKFMNAAVAFVAILAGPAVAGNVGENPSLVPTAAAWSAPGQQAAPRAITAGSALPACGFAAIESWGPNGFQFCDAGNVRGDDSQDEMSNRRTRSFQR